MRPLYETKRDLANEKAVILKWQHYIGGAVRKAAPTASFDYEWFSESHTPDLPGLHIEIKCRGKLYPDLLLSKRKWDALVDDGGILIWSTPEKTLWMVAVNNDSIRVDRGGRIDRGDPLDMETCVFIPQNLFLEVL